MSYPITSTKLLPFSDLCKRFQLKNIKYSQGFNSFVVKTTNFVDKISNLYIFKND